MFFSTVVKSRSRSQVTREMIWIRLTSIVDPNAEIREGYESIFIETNDNLSISGFLVDEGISTITLRSFDGLDKTFQKNHIKSLKPLGRSLMPANLLNGLSEYELRDFLRICVPPSHLLWTSKYNKPFDEASIGNLCSQMMQIFCLPLQIVLIIVISAFTTNLTPNFNSGNTK